MPGLRVTERDLVSDTSSRFDRFKLIGWWDQQRLAESRVFVIGAGALGNEIVKNLALLGIGNILILDLDTIENSNLSRSVLYRAGDSGKPKAAVAATAARDIYPDIKAHHIQGNVLHDVGAGLFQWADVVIGGLDNREARLAINRQCYRLGKPWIDGAIEQIQGVARVFAPDGPCYECTLSAVDWQLLQKRRSCNLLSKQEMLGGKTPTTPTISSIIAGVQCQEAVKLLHGLPTLKGRGWYFQGLTGDSWTIEYQRKEDCYSHDPLDAVINLDASCRDFTARMLLSVAKEQIGEDAWIDLSRDIVEKLVCPKCHASEDVFAPVSRLKHSDVRCPECEAERRELVTFNCIRGGEPYVDRCLAALGIPLFDILTVRSATRVVGFAFTADAPSVLGELYVPGQECFRHA